MTTEDEATTLAMTSTSAIVNPIITAMSSSPSINGSEDDTQFPFCRYDLDSFHTA